MYDQEFGLLLIFATFIGLVIANTSRLNVYGDLACLQGSGYVTPKPSDNGLCHNLIHIRSVRPIDIDSGCAGKPPNPPVPMLSRRSGRDWIQDRRDTQDESLLSNKIKTNPII